MVESVESKDFIWLNKKYFILGRGWHNSNQKTISARMLLNIMIRRFNDRKFYTSMMTHELIEWNPCGEQVTKILKEFAKRGFIRQENTQEGIDGKGAKRARYIYEVI